MANQIMHLFKDTDLRAQHNGLIEVARRAKVNLEELSPGEHVVFINSRADKLKIFSSSGLLSYYRAPEKSRLNLNMIKILPKCFGARGGLDFAKADKLAVEELLGKYERKRAIQDDR